MDLDGKIALVTGSTDGVGRLVARQRSKVLGSLSTDAITNGPKPMAFMYEGSARPM